MISTVHYRVGTYEGNVDVFGVHPDDESEHVIARARKIVTRLAGGTLPPGSELWTETAREPDPSEHVA